MPSPVPYLVWGDSTIMAIFRRKGNKLFPRKVKTSVTSACPLSVYSKNLCSSRETDRTLAGIIPLPSSNMATALGKLPLQQMITPLNDNRSAALALTFPLGCCAETASRLFQDRHQSKTFSCKIVKTVDHPIRISQNETNVNTALLYVERAA